MNNNKGFTLVELIVSLAIFGIIISAAFGFMLSGLKSFNNVNSKIELQMHSQVTMNFISEYLIDCDEAIYYSNDTLYIINKSKNGPLTAYVFNYDINEKSIFFSERIAQKNDDGSYTLFSSEPKESELLSDLVENFHVIFNQKIKGDYQPIVSVEFTADFKNHSSQTDKTKTIALRNKPMYSPVSIN